MDIKNTYNMHIMEGSTYFNRKLQALHTYCCLYSYLGQLLTFANQTHSHASLCNNMPTISQLATPVYIKNLIDRQEQSIPCFFYHITWRHPRTRTLSGPATASHYQNTTRTSFSRILFDSSDKRISEIYMVNGYTKVELPQKIHAQKHCLNHKI